jgi:FixJ family two-component response regulator
VTRPVVYVVDDDPMVCRGVERLLDTIGLQSEVFTSADEFLASFDFERTGCAILDVRLHGVNGLEVQRRLTTRGATVPVIFLTGHADVSLAVRAMKAGAVDVLEKPIDSQALVDAVQQAIVIDTQRRADLAALTALRQRAAHLTAREREVMACVVSGRSNKVIADLLGATEKTIKVHRASVMAKMGAGSLPDLVRMVDRLALHDASALVVPQDQAALPSRSSSGR